MVPTPRDLVDCHFWQQLLQILALGIVFFLHCGTPCNTFTSARKLDGGPPPCGQRSGRSAWMVCAGKTRCWSFWAILFLERTVEACLLVFAFGGDFMIENPLLSLLWATPQLLELVRRTRAFQLDCDQCAFGTPWKKPTRFVSSSELLETLAVACPGGHVHQKLKGKVWDPQRQQWVFKTKQAQVYPHALCVTIAQQLVQLFAHRFAHLRPTFALCVPSADRKRALHSEAPWKGHRQADTAKKALAAGYQLKRGAAKPLFELEMEPGEAVQFALQLVHPFSRPPSLDDALEEAIALVATAPQRVLRLRLDALNF